LEKIKHQSAEVKRNLERLNNESERVEQQNNEREIRYCRLYDQVMDVPINLFNFLLFLFIFLF